MIKNIQLKIVLIFFILGMFIIIGLGLFFTNSLEAINTALNTAQITDVIIEEINKKYKGERESPIERNKNEIML